jgi:hypothetical protein
MNSKRYEYDQQQCYVERRNRRGEWVMCGESGPYEYVRATYDYLVDNGAYGVRLVGDYDDRVIEEVHGGAGDYSYEDFWND